MVRYYEYFCFCSQGYGIFYDVKKLWYNAKFSIFLLHQLTMNTRLAPFALSAILPLFLFSWFVPTGMLQLDLLALWGIAMVLIGLPMLFLELALAKRSQKTVWQGMQVLTREADAKTHWRSFSYLGVLVAFVLSAGLVKFGADGLAKLPALAHIPTYAMSFVLSFVALILGFLKGRLLLVGAIFVLLGALLSLVLGGVGTIGISNVSVNDWAVAITLALASVGVGTGLYWFLAGQNSQKSITAQALPIWAVQWVAGVLSLAVHSFGFGETGQLVSVAGVVLVAGFFVYVGASQLIGRFGLITGLMMSVIGILALSAVPSVAFGWVFLVVGLLSALVLAIFAGYVMKISHLRKTLQFKSELSYNLWRIAVRWLVPVAIVFAWGVWAWLLVV